jgi:TRAP-type C4-dicarboxylate transport system permease small subunit
LEPLATQPVAPTGKIPVEHGLGICARIALMALCAVVTVSVVSRALWNNIIPDDVLLVSELMLVVILAPLALVTAMREHIVVSIFTDRLGAGMRRALDILGHLVGLLLFGVLTYAFASMLLNSWSTGEYYEGILGIPHYIGHAFATVAMAVVVMRLLLLLLADLRRRID